jgi:hypothetical protein
MAVVESLGMTDTKLTANESAKDAWPGSSLAAAKYLKLLSLEPAIKLPGWRRQPRWRRHYQMGLSGPNVIALNPRDGKPRFAK